MNQQEILTDFTRRYDQSYIFVVAPDSKEENLFFVDKISVDEKNVATFALSSPEFGKIMLNYGTAHTLKFKYPPVGVFQRGHDAYIFRRLPQKQYKVGLYYGNCQCYPVHVELEGRTKVSKTLNFEQVVDAYASEKYRYRDAVKMLKSGKFRSVALHRDFSLMLSMTGVDQHILMHWETPVASINIETQEVMVLEKAYANIIEQVRGS